MEKVIENLDRNTINKKIRQLLPYVGMLVIGFGFLFIYAGVIDNFTLLQCELIIVFGYIAAILDIKTKYIPNTLVLILLAIWVFIMTPMLFFDTNTAVVLLKDSVIGFFVGGGLFLLVYLISRKGLGGGDVKFMAVTGLYVGFAGILSVMLYGSILAAITGLVLLLLKKIKRKDTIPLAPFLYIGILITVFYR